MKLNLLICWVYEREIFLDWLDRPNVITRVPKNRREREKSPSSGDVTCNKDVSVILSEDSINFSWVWRQRMVSVSKVKWKPMEVEEARKHSPLKPPEELFLHHSWFWPRETHVRLNDLANYYKGKHLCCLKPLSFWQFFIAAIEN